MDLGAECSRKRALLRNEVVKLAGWLFYAADEIILLADESASKHELQNGDVE